MYAVNKGVTNVLLQLIADVVNVPKQTNLLDSVIVDAAFTNSTMFRFEWPSSVATGNKCDMIHVNITTPDGTVLNSNNYNPTSTRIEIPGSSSVVSIIINLNLNLEIKVFCE